MKNDYKELIALRNGHVLPERSGEYWTKDDQNTLNRLFWNGYDISEIALHLRRTELAICQQLLKNDMFAQQCKPRDHKKKSKKRCRCSDCNMQDCQRYGKEVPDVRNI